MDKITTHQARYDLYAAERRSLEAGFGHHKKVAKIALQSGAATEAQRYGRHLQGAGVASKSAAVVVDDKDYTNKANQIGNEAYADGENNLIRQMDWNMAVPYDSSDAGDDRQDTELR